MRGLILLLTLGFSFSSQAQTKSIKVPQKKSTAAFNRIQAKVMPIGGHTYHVWERLNEKGLVVRQLLVSDKQTTFWQDTDGDGSIDIWETQTSNGRVTLHEPFHGHFLIMDIEQQMPEQRLLLRYAYNERKNAYQLYGIKKQPLHKLFYQQSFFVGCTGDENDKAMQKLAKEMNSFLQTDSNRKSLRDIVDKSILGDNCKTGDFAAAHEAMVNAIMMVVGSDSDPYSGQKPSKGMFLQCMRHYDLTIHASRIEGAFAQYIPTLQGKTRPNGWNVTCERDRDTVRDGSNSDQLHTASYNPDNRTVTFHLTPQQLLDNPTVKPQAAYAKTFFHEMIHYSGIDDENTTDTIEQCCSQSGNENGPACTKLQKMVDAKKLAQQVENEFIKKVPGLELGRDQLRQQVGPNADGMIDNFYMEIGMMYDKYQHDDSCHPKDPAKNPYPDSILGTCTEKFKAELEKTLDAYFSEQGTKSGRRCFAEASGAFKDVPDHGDRSAADYFCGTLQSAIYDIMNLDLPKGQTDLCHGSAKSKQGFFDFLFSASLAFAASDSSPDGKMCLLAQDHAPFDFNAITFSGNDNASVSGYGLSSSGGGTPRAYEITSPLELDNTKKEVEQNTRVTQSSGQPQRFNPDHAGPDRPLLIADAQEGSDRRKNDIRNYLENMDGVASRSRDIVSRSLGSLLPEAAASTTQNAATPSRTIASLQQFNLPDPMPAAPHLLANPVSMPTLTTTSASRAVAANQVAGAPQATAPDIILPAVTANGGALVPTAAAAASAAGPSRPLLASAGTRPNTVVNTDLEQLLETLRGPYQSVEPLLVKPAVVGRMLRHKVQVADKAGGVHGAAEPVIRLRYDSATERLKLVGKENMTGGSH